MSLNDNNESKHESIHTHNVSQQQRDIATANRSRTASFIGSEPPEPPRGCSDETSAPEPVNNHHHRAIAVIVLFVCVAGLSAAMGSWFWWNNYRQFDISINNQTLRVTGRQSLASLLKDHHYFDKHPGRLLSVSGKTLEAHGGDPILVKRDNTRIQATQLSSTHLASGDVVTVSDGNDAVESHLVEDKTVAYATQMKNHGAIQFVAQQGQDGKQENWVGKLSHETAVKRTIQQPRDLIIDSISPKPPADKKVIALTFDDGPSSFSAPILQILKSKDAKATFMDIGDQSAAMPNIEQQMLADGNQVASHSFSHPDLTTLNRDALRKQLTAGFDAINKASNSTTRMLRAPYGSFNKQTWMNSCDLVSSNILWTIDTQDWEQPGEQQIKKQVMDNAYSGAIVLMHDGGGDRTQDVKILPEIIDGLKSQGYQFVTIDELIAMDSRFPTWVRNNEVAPSSAKE